MVMIMSERAPVRATGKVVLKSQNPHPHPWPCTTTRVVSASVVEYHMAMHLHTHTCDRVRVAMRRSCWHPYICVSAP